MIFFYTYIFLPSSTALLALLANCSVENVSALEVIDGETQNMKVIFPVPDRESLKILVNLEFLNGI